MRFNSTNASSRRSAATSRRKVSTDAESCARSRLPSLASAPRRRCHTSVWSYEGKSSQGSDLDDWPQSDGTLRTVRNKAPTTWIRLAFKKTDPSKFLTTVDDTLANVIGKKLNVSTTSDGQVIGARDRRCAFTKNQLPFVPSVAVTCRPFRRVVVRAIESKSVAVDHYPGRLR